MCVLVWKSTYRCPLGIIRCLEGFCCLGCSFTSVSQRGREDRTDARQRETQYPRFNLRRTSGHMAGLAALCLLLVFPLSSSQSTLQSEQKINAHQAPAAPPSPPHIRDLLRKEETTHLNAKRTYAHVDKDNAKVGLFIAAAMGTFALMAAVYCIYNKFYTKHQYLHTQLHDDSDSTTDNMDPPPVFYHASAGPSAVDVRRAGYGSVSATPSIISVPPSLSPPPSAMPFPPVFLSSQSLRTISARDLEKSCI
ncbi:uncharacterized protein LOC125880717 isoform X1 [Epinephelus fuscoguttatus]|uniref:uncharacterized protein LOC125880717 isoform X1 n=2 Tax=Epinephelus fuscoguttatus TaxID=293821 RepID=UPI0020D022EB|nr:uncharacterized protein LOC125880717 isoform X1 [Epinephelus fuscoguttatus]XP_049419385.1 uncharacterized protein LOC125880717 isoform X1 [Epinephelus fuscoguttatus]